MQHATSPVFERIANATWTFSRRYWRLVVVAMLLLLHVAAFRGVADPWARALLLAHLGLLLLWQPFLRAEQRVSATQGVILLIVAAVVMLRLDWWLLAFWVVVIAGLVGGKVYQHDAKWQRRCYLVMLAYLLALLAIVILPEIAPRREINADTRRAAEYTLPFFFVLIALFPAERESGEAPQMHRFLLQRVPDAAPRGGDPRQLHVHDRARARATSRRSPIRCSSRRGGAPRRARLESALGGRPGRVFRALSVSRSGCRSSAGCRCWRSSCARKPRPRASWRRR